MSEKIDKKLLDDAIEISEEIESKLRKEIIKIKKRYERKLQEKQEIIKRYKEKIKEHYVPFHVFNSKLYQRQKQIMKLLGKIEKLERENRTLTRLYQKFNPYIKEELKNQEDNK